MSSFGSKRRLSRALLAAVLGTVVLAASAGTAARAGDDGDDELLDTKFVRGFLKALGLKKDGDQANINYRERSPLVLPANDRDLPPPETVNPAAKAAGWPDDPDVKEAKRRKVAEKNRKAYVEGVDDRPLLPNQYNPKNLPPHGNPNEAAGKTIDETSKPSSMAELGSKGILSGLKDIWKPKVEYKPFTGEPPRAELTDPPAGYRTPSPNQPYGVGPEKWKPQAIDRQEPAR